MAQSGWQRRNQLARDQGYKSYYDYRAHDYGRLPPSAPRLSGEDLRLARGHASYSDLLALVQGGRVEILSQIPGERDPASGQYRSVTFDVQLSSGRTARFVLRGADLKGPRIARLRGALAAGGSDVYVNPSVDVLQLSDEADDELGELDFDEEDVA